MNNSEPSDCDIEIGTAMRLLNNLCNANSSFARAVPHKQNSVDEVANYLCVCVRVSQKSGEDALRKA